MLDKTNGLQKNFNNSILEKEDAYNDRLKNISYSIGSTSIYAITSLEVFASVCSLIDRKIDRYNSISSLVISAFSPNMRIRKVR